MVTNLIRVGEVSSTNPARGTVRVAFRDRDDQVSAELPVIVQNGAYWIPRVNDRVLCVFLGDRLGTGYVLGTFYNAAQAPPATNPALSGVWLEDGSHVYFDRAAGVLRIHASGGVEITGGLTVDSLSYPGGGPP